MSIEDERAAIAAAMERLLAGTPLYSSGNLTIVSLAEEARLKRHTLTHRHLDLKAQFYGRVKAQFGMLPIEISLRKEIATLTGTLKNARDEAAELRENIARYARVIRLLSVENDALINKKASNVSSIDERRAARGSLDTQSGRHPEVDS